MEDKLGRGIAFIVVVAFPSRVAEPASSEPPTAGRILLLDDDTHSRDGLGSILKAENFTLQSPNPAKPRLQELASNHQPDLILLHTHADMGLLLSWIRELGATVSQAPILVLVPAGELSTALEALQFGAYDYLLEPWVAEQMLAAVRRAIGYRRLQMQNDLYRVHLEQMIAARTQTLQRTMHQLERSYDVTLEALGDALDLKDAETEGHSKRVTAYTLALGRAVGLREPELRVVGRGAFLHDIGKMAVPDAILRKPGRLTEEEQAVMRTHSELGYQMLRKIPFLHDAAEIVFAHQEHYDGSGYPRRLRGEQIPMGARIFALADTLDAMTSTRPYRKATTIAAARKEILRCAGSQFDPAIVDVFLATPDVLWHELRDGIMRDGRAFSPFGFTFGEVV